MTQSSILCQYTFLGGGARHFALLWQHGVYSVGFFLEGRRSLAFFGGTPRSCCPAAALFWDYTPSPGARRGTAFRPLCGSTPMIGRLDPSSVFSTITLTYARRVRHFPPSRSSRRSAPTIYSQNYAPPREAAVGGISNQSVRLRALAVPPHQWLK